MILLFTTSSNINICGLLIDTLEEAAMFLFMLFKLGGAERGRAAPGVCHRIGQTGRGFALRVSVNPPGTSLDSEVHRSVRIEASRSGFR